MTQFTALKIETVNVEMGEEPHTDEDTLVGSSLRQSSRKVAHDAAQSINCRRKKGLIRKTAS